MGAGRGTLLRSRKVDISQFVFGSGIKEYLRQRSITMAESWDSSPSHLMMNAMIWTYLCVSFAYGQVLPKTCDVLVGRDGGGSSHCDDIFVSIFI